MAPADDAGKKKRENQYFDVGVQGRKTGVTLEDRGVRDEHGMELIDGIFSSPEKSPAKRPARGDDRTLTSSEMDIQQSSMPEPAETLSARRSLKTSGKTSLPPPLGRSPIKTNLGSSPRRQSSMGPPSQPRQSAQPSGRAASHPVVARRLDFSSNGKGQEIEASPGQSSGSGGRAARRKHLDEIEESPVQQTRRTMNESILEAEEDEQEDEAPADEDINGHSPAPINGDESTQMLPEQDEPEDEDDIVAELIASPEPPPKKGPKARKRRTSVDESTEQIHNEAEEVPVAQPRKRGRPKSSGLLIAQSNNAVLARSNRTGRAQQKAANADQANESEEDVDAPAEDPSALEEPAAAPAKKRGRKPKAKPTEAVEDTMIEEPSALEEPVAAPAKKRGRKPKAAPTQTTEDASIVNESAQEDPKKGRPAKKRGRIEVEQDVQAESEPPAKRSKQKGPQKKPPSERDPNAKVVSASAKTKKSKTQARESSVASASAAAALAQPRQRMRQETPYQDPNAPKTRFGRAVIKPVEYYKGAKAKYDRDGNITGIIHIDEELPEKRKRQRKASSKPRRKARVAEEEEEEEEPELEEWEESEGKIAGTVNGWDEIHSAPMQEWQREEDIAFARIETDEVSGANFTYSKMFGVPFFGAGMVDMPPGGIKRTKNSRKMHMAFCVLKGKVSVTIQETTFTISKGGVFVVPRGNSYSISNETEDEVRLFFAQGCEVAPGTTEASIDISRMPVVDDEDE